MSEPEKRIALLIDADNAPASKIDEVLAEVARYGVANVRRAYGNWKSPRLKGWKRCCTSMRSARSSSSPTARARMRRTWRW
jgi:uncharacterized LabA/DUF88 family protein